MQIKIQVKNFICAINILHYYLKIKTKNLNRKPVAIKLNEKLLTSKLIVVVLKFSFQTY